ncbi:ThiF family adenylyltransferase [Kocuria rhizophila]|nr:ThiF family adenylyltransferase [Kocuria rhizophila]
MQAGLLARGGTRSAPRTPTLASSPIAGHRCGQGHLAPRELARRSIAEAAGDVTDERSLPVFDPLVEPGAELTREELNRYSRHLTLAQFGPEGAASAREARTCPVVGAGGLGAPALRVPRGHRCRKPCGIVDDDVVSVSNLQRQVIHARGGRRDDPKVNCADALARLNPLVTVQTHDARLSTDNALEILGQYDLVLDGADNFATRYLLADTAELTGIPVVWGSILRFDGRSRCSGGPRNRCTGTSTRRLPRPAPSRAGGRGAGRPAQPSAP